MHTLRHTASMRFLHAGIDTSVIALWLGHEQIATTGIYLHADLSIKQQALDGTRPPEGSAGRYQADDTLPAWLSNVLRQGSCRISGFESDHTEGSG